MTFTLHTPVNRCDVLFCRFDPGGILQRPCAWHLQLSSSALLPDIKGRSNHWTPSSFWQLPHKWIRWLFKIQIELSHDLHFELHVVLHFTIKRQNRTKRLFESWLVDEGTICGSMVHSYQNQVIIHMCDRLKMFHAENQNEFPKHKSSKTRKFGLSNFAPSCQGAMLSR